MELFQKPLADLKQYLEEAGEMLTLSAEETDNPFSWPAGSSLVLQDDVALELGGAAGSQLVILWTAAGDAVDDHKISIVGPDLETANNKTLPLSLVILVSGSFEDAYETYRALQDKVIDTALKGVSVRIWPDRQKIWCRVSRNAAEKGFSLKHYAFSLLQNLKSIPAVERAEIIFSTEPLINGEQPVELASKAKAVLEILVNIYEQETFDCESCDFRETCVEVAGLKEMHRRLHEEKTER